MFAFGFLVITRVVVVFLVDFGSFSLSANRWPVT